MKLRAILYAVAAAAASLSDTPPEGIAPSEPSPEGCKQTVHGNFTLGTLIIRKGSEKRESVEEATKGLLVCTLENGILHDPLNRTGSIVANYQFQFDGPPQAGAIYTGGFSVCPNGTLAIGGSTLFYRCGSGDFYNLYDRWIAGQCEAAHIMVTLKNAPASSSSAIAASSSPVSPTGSVSASTTDSAASASATGIAVSTMHSGTIATASPSPSSSAGSAASTLAPASSVRGGAEAPPVSSTGGAVPTRVPRRETFGAVVGILGAALIL
ncbi:hypothetical protein BCR34DRAFT_517530 [Clohesyomyces aquaticus]|uniref:Cell wall mannoprotein PIR1-like C-terminal domain-containing protein n=1 Tax=Clohesyomyces aquaticus TaxID=1231657 RepID=A0A1Y1ZE95_9PLEO|nr:hypothetical protein BCR34DRAFT_517530 [Clohesyomyces aquaticus]